MPTSSHRLGEPPGVRSTNLRKFFLFLLKCVIMVVIFSIFLFFLGFAAIVLLHFLFMSNTFHRRCTRFFHPTDPASRSIVFPTPTAFDSPHIQAQIVNVVYSAAALQRTRDCAICLDSFQEGDNCSSLPVCKHLFHAKCVDRWIRKRPNCPICRTGVDLASGLPCSSISADDTWKRLWPIGFEQGNSH
ncbi:LOW QUALITY PROTEIN: RING-H2 finger protein ATL56-like [Primulina tabacum]|uniref:LOW QUALITY PROTEIN: RING-H2 finger protein ATL56-like n=1 Tax=Primulina tabacum TaxID=48773 RepID=UPI003F5AD237